MTQLVFIALGAGLIGLFLGLMTWPLFLQTYVKPVDPQELSQMMEGVVNGEEVDELRRVRRAAMLRAGRRTVRGDGGPPAKVHRMRRRKTHNRPWE